VEEAGGVDTKPYNKDSMVQTTGTAQEGEWMAHPSHVELHRECIECDTDGPVLEQPLGHLVFVLINLHPATHSHRDFRPVEPTGFIIPIIAIVRLRLQAPDIEQGLVCILHETSATTSIQWVTVHQLLLGQTDQFAIPDSLLPLHIARHTECPAGSTHSLVLHLSNSSMVPPVKGFRQLHVRNICRRPVDLWGIIARSGVSKVIFLEFLRGEISQMCGSIDSSALLSILQ